MANEAQRGSPGGWGAVKSSSSSSRTATTTTEEGTYTDPSGKKITRAEAMSRGYISSPGETASKLASIGAIGGGAASAPRVSGIEQAKAAEQEYGRQKPPIPPSGIEAMKARELSLAQSRAGTTKQEAYAITQMLKSPTSSVTEYGYKRGAELAGAYNIPLKSEDIPAKYTVGEEFRRTYPSLAPKAYYPEKTIADIGQTAFVRQAAMSANYYIQPLPKTMGERYDFYSQAGIERGRDAVFAGQEKERYEEAQRQKAEYDKTYWQKLSPVEKATSYADLVSRNVFTGTAKYALTGKNIFKPENVYDMHRQIAQQSFIKSVSQNEGAVLVAASLGAGGVLGGIARYSPRAAKYIGGGVALYAGADIGSKAVSGKHEQALAEGLSFAVAAPIVKSGYGLVKGAKLPTYRDMFGTSRATKVRELRSSLIGETAYKYKSEYPAQIATKQISTYRKMFGVSSETRIKELRATMQGEAESAFKPEYPAQTITPKTTYQKMFGTSGRVSRATRISEIQAERVIPGAPKVMIPSGIPTQFTTKPRQLFKGKPELYEPAYKYKPTNQYEYIEDIRADLARAEASLIKGLPGRSKTIAAQSIIGRTEAKSELKEKIKEIESIESMVIPARKETINPFKAQIVDLSRGQKIKAPRAVKFFIGSDIKKIGLVQPQRQIQVQRAKPLLAPRPQFGTVEGYYKQLPATIKATKGKSGIYGIKSSLTTAQQTRQLTIAEQKHLELLRSSKITGSKKAMGLTGILGLTQSQVSALTQSQVQTQTQVQTQMQKQIQKQMQLQRQRQTQRQIQRIPQRPIQPPPIKPIKIKLPKTTSAAFKKRTSLFSGAGKFSKILGGKTFKTLSSGLLGSTKKATKRKTKKRKSKR